MAPANAIQFKVSGVPGARFRRSRGSEHKRLSDDPDFGLHMAETDSRNYIYAGEVFAGERIQRFVPAESARGKLLTQLENVK